jgi:hypothetical protein
VRAPSEGNLSEQYFADTPDPLWNYFEGAGGVNQIMHAVSRQYFIKQVFLLLDHLGVYTYSNSETIPYRGMASVDSTEVHPGFLNTKTAYHLYQERYINSI